MYVCMYVHVSVCTFTCPSENSNPVLMFEYKVARCSFNEGACRGEAALLVTNECLTSVSASRQYHNVQSAILEVGIN